MQQYLPPGSAQDQQRGDLYAPLYRAHGFEVRYIGRKPAFARRLARNPRTWARHFRDSLEYKGFYVLLDAVVRRFNDWRIVRLSRRFDVVQLIKTNSPQLVRRLRRRTKARLVFDLADALWLPVHARRFGDVKAILPAVDAITCDNETGLAYARRFNPSCHLWPPASQVELFDRERATARAGRPDDGTVTLGWLGSPSTASNLFLVFETLEELSRRHPNLRLRLVGVPPEFELLRRCEHIRFTTLPSYTREEMVREVLRMDIGLFPLFDLEESTTHGITKALVYMAGGVAVVCSPVGACPELVQDGVNGLVASGRREWTEKLDRLIRDAALRRRLGEAGLATVRAGYTLERCFDSMRPALG